MASGLIPVAKSMVLCTDVLPGPDGTGNVHLMNVFSGIRPRSDPPFPYRLPQLCVFLQLTDAVGQVPGRIEGRQADSDRIVFASQEQSIRFRDRLQVAWVLFRLTDCPFPEEGLYWIQFYCHDHLVADQRVRLLE
jgi:hypothetical protein